MQDLPLPAFGVIVNNSFPMTYPTKKRAILLTIIISIAYGGLTEIMQETITVLHRSGDWRDLIADSIGTGLGILVFYLFFRHKK
jgi:VanZ family protein